MNVKKDRAGRKAILCRIGDPGTRVGLCVGGEAIAIMKGVRAKCDSRSGKCSEEKIRRMLQRVKREAKLGVSGEETESGAAWNNYRWTIDD